MDKKDMKKKRCRFNPERTNRGMTYSEFRSTFESVEEFRREFGSMSFEDACALISAEHASPSIKAAMIGSWRRAREEYREDYGLR